MLSNNLQKTFESIVTEAVKMVASNIDNHYLTGRFNYASIYAQSDDEYNQISKELSENGDIELERESGNYFKLHNPLLMMNNKITVCRIRKFDKDHPERGYLDFEVNDYAKFKEKYVTNANFSLLNEGEEMLELKDQRFNVRAYFPSGEF